MNSDSSIFSKETLALYTGERIDGMDLMPEALPLFTCTAFNQDTLSNVKRVYDEKGYTYIRSRNPNRDALAETVSFLEEGESTLILSSGMAAISTTLLNLLKSGDHVICNRDIYGETHAVMTEFLPKFNVETDMVSFLDTDNIVKAIRPNTKIIYTEVVSNPCIRVADIPKIAEIAHEHNALLVVDNTFTSAVNIKPLTMGADIVINSMTKFMNGHSDAIGGSVTASRELTEKIDVDSKLLGSPCDPFDSWMILRGIRSINLRVPKQAENAAKLAAALEKNPHILFVNHPSLKSNGQYELAKKIFKGNLMTGMLSFAVPEDMDKIDAFMKRLQFAHYAMTLGGYRSSLSHPCVSSHSHVPDEIRREMGITPGLFRLSVGIENAEDLIQDFNRALEVFD